MTDPLASPDANRLLASLQTRDQRRLLRRVETVALRACEDLHEVGQAVKYVHFPTKGCVISVIKVLGDGKSLDADLVGYEGLIGVEPLLGVGEAQLRATVRLGGSALRMEAEAFRAEIRGGGSCPKVFQRYLQYLLLTFSQIAGCNCFHLLERHLGAWILRMQDRIGADTLDITHAVLAKMLGVRRVGITQAARQLQEAGLIRYSWGKLTILDREGLKTHACVCYEQHNKAYQRLLDPAWPYE